VLVAVLGLGWAVYALSSGDHKTTAKPPGKPTTGATASVTPSPTPTPTTVPAGFKIYKGDGFTTAVPADWDGPKKWDSPGEFFFNGSDRSTRLIFRKLADTTDSALDVMKSRQGEALAGKGGYTPPVIGPATGPGADPTGTGTKAADLVYEWRSDSGKKHILERTVVMNGHAYAITLQLSADSWQSDLQHLAPVLSNFTPTP
jgi:hypothetical protein